MIYYLIHSIIVYLIKLITVSIHYLYYPSNSKLLYFNLCVCVIQIKSLIIIVIYSSLNCPIITENRNISPFYFTSLIILKKKKNSNHSYIIIIMLYNKKERKNLCFLKLLNKFILNLTFQLFFFFKNNNFVLFLCC